MPLSGPTMKAAMKTAIVAGLTREFANGNTSPTITQSFDQLADALSDIALVVVQQIQTNAQVNPGTTLLPDGTVGPGTIS